MASWCSEEEVSLLESLGNNCSVSTATHSAIIWRIQSTDHFPLISRLMCDPGWEHYVFHSLPSFLWHQSIQRHNSFSENMHRFPFPGLFFNIMSLRVGEEAFILSGRILPDDTNWNVVCVREMFEQKMSNVICWCLSKSRCPPQGSLGVLALFT